MSELSIKFVLSISILPCAFNLSSVGPLLILVVRDDYKAFSFNEYSQTWTHVQFSTRLAHFEGNFSLSFSTNLRESLHLNSSLLLTDSPGYQRKFAPEITGDFSRIWERWSDWSSVSEQKTFAISPVMTTWSVCWYDISYGIIFE